jgi:hypothetical protein
MKSGKSIVELAKQLEDIRNNSKDFIVPTAKLSMKVVGMERGLTQPQPLLTFTNGGEVELEMNDWANRQMAEYTKIPQVYYDRIRHENPALFQDSVNHGLTREASTSAIAGKPDLRMIRTYRGSVRALLSNRYRRLDCYDLLETVFPIMQEHGLQPKSTQITDRITAEVKKGDAVQYGLTISSSDVGAGSVRIEPLLYRLVCLNGMVMESAIKKFHIGKAQGEDDFQELLTDETQEVADKAFWMQVHDVVLGTLQQKYFDTQVDRLRIAANEEIRNFDIPRVIELASKHVGVTSEGVKNSMVAYLANGADGAGLTRWGLANAFTHAAQDEEISYDDAYDLERAGAKILDLPKSAWSAISSSPVN